MLLQLPPHFNEAFPSYVQTLTWLRCRELDPRYFVKRQVNGIFGVHMFELGLLRRIDTLLHHSQEDFTCVDRASRKDAFEQYTLVFVEIVICANSSVRRQHEELDELADCFQRQKGDR